MHVSLSSNFVQNKKTINLNSKTNYLSTKQVSKDNITFGSDAGLIYLVARGGLAAIKDGPKNYKVAKFLGEMSDVIESPSYYKSKLADTLSALGKTPDNIDGGGSVGHAFASFLAGRDNILSILSPEQANLRTPELRQKAIKILSLTEDDNNVNIQSKKDFISSLFQNGHQISKEFRDEFAKLKDAYYGKFKEEIIDKCFYSKEYNQSRHNVWNTLVPVMSAPNCHYFTNLELVETLDNLAHRNYLNARLNVINAEKKVLIDCAREDIRSSHPTYHMSVFAGVAEDGIRLPLSHMPICGADSEKYHRVAVYDIYRQYNVDHDIEKATQALNLDKETFKKFISIANSRGTIK